jgi:hypothetical protein
MPFFYRKALTPDARQSACSGGNASAWQFAQDVASVMTLHGAQAWAKVPVKGRAGTLSICARAG